MTTSSERITEGFLLLSRAIKHRVGQLEIKISYPVNALFSFFMSLQSLGLAAIARNQIQMARLPTVSYYALRPSFTI